MSMKIAGRFAAIALGGLTAFCAPLSAKSRPAGPAGDERVLFDAANRERAIRHIPVLHWDEKLAQAARDHALLMARNRDVSHQFPGEPGLSSRVSHAGVKFSFVAENVGDADNAADLHDAWMKSPGHRANLLEARVDSLGIAVVAIKGLIYAVEDFANVLPLLSLEEQERRVSALLKARGLRRLETTAAVRSTCALSHGVDLGLRPKYLFRYLTADIGVLPPELLDELAKHRGEYHSAAVGACAASQPGDLTVFRIAVLLY